MPLPDAKPDKRIYELLKTVDLENLTFADFQGVAKTIYAEQGAEDELRRIVLVNLARLAVKGNWNGLTTAASGGNDYNVELIEDVIATAYDEFLLTALPPWGSGSNTNESYSSSNNNDKVFFIPFIAPKTGDVSELSIHVQSSGATNVDVGIYSCSDSTGAPDSLLGKATLSASSTGTISQTSFSDTISLTKGTQYYIGFVRTSAGVNITLAARAVPYGATVSTVDGPTAAQMNMLRLNGSDTVLPTSPTLTNLFPNTKNPLAVSVKI